MLRTLAFIVADTAHASDVDLAAAILFGLVAISALVAFLSVRYIPNTAVGVVEKLWSFDGSVPGGAIIAKGGQAGFQADLLRGGLHLGYWRWQYRVHRAMLVTVPQGQIGYVYARDGIPLEPTQTLGRIVDCDSFQNARAFLDGSADRPRGQRGRQRAILREGVYAINPALFVVITADHAFSLRAINSRQEAVAIDQWQEELTLVAGFQPVRIGGAVTVSDPLHPSEELRVDTIGIVTIHDGPALMPGEIIAPGVGTDAGDPNYHNNYQDVEAFLRAGGRRGRQSVPLTDGTYFLNRWFASVEAIAKTVVPIGHVGVVVSYHGRAGRDLSGDSFRHGERVAEGERGVWERPLGPGKYAFNTFAGAIVLVPTTNFVLHWITGKSESHRFDESLRSIDLVTKDAYEPLLPLSVVVHIDYQRAPSVIQRFGDVKKLITQTIDPMLSAYFRDIAHTKTMLGLLHERDQIQQEAREEMRRKFREFDIECVDVLIGKPDTSEKDGKIEGLLEQLRLRQLSIEQVETYEQQRAAAEGLKLLHDAQAHAEMQTRLTNTQVEVRISESQGEAELVRARKQAEQTVVEAEARLARARRQAEETVLLAGADSKQAILAGRGEAQRAMQVGLAEALVLLRKISAFGDPRLFALDEVTARLATSAQPLVPERLFVSGSDGGAAGTGLVGTLLSLLVAEKSGFTPTDATETAALASFAEKMAAKAIATLGAEDDVEAAAHAE